MSRFVGVPALSRSEFVHLSTSAGKTITFWAAFTNPNRDNRLALDKATMQLVIVPRGKRIQPPFEDLPKVTLEEHRKIAHEFLAQVDLPDRQYFQQIADAPNSWPQWFWHIRNDGGGKYFNAWLNFRTEALRKTFEERLAKLGLDQTAAAPLIDKLLESKQRKPRQSDPSVGFTRSSAPYNRKTTSKQTPTSENEIRRLAIIALSEMTVDELRRLWLPLGAIMTGFRSDES